MRTISCVKWFKSLTNLLRCLPVVVLSCLLFGEAALGAEPKMAVAVTQSGEAFVVDVMIEVQVPLVTAWEVLTDFATGAYVRGILRLA